jgi:tRNA-2-methylthio-N6-dimethylallyladenosine synthase
MYREYTPEHYLGLLEKLRAAQPEIVLSTDIIAGFVNETEEEHQATLDLLDKAQFDFIYSYVYSKRNKTRAASMEDTLSDKVRNKRLREIQAHQLKIQYKIHQTMIGKNYRILVDSDGNMGGVKKWKGRSNCNRIVHFIPQDLTTDYKWHWVEVEITSATALSCQGNFVRDLGRRLS